MKNLTNFFGLFVFAIFLTLTACTGDTGPIGPAGTNGTNGVDGTSGTDGRDGMDGEDGNANVFTSDWYNLDSWSAINSTFGFQDHAAPEITANDINKSVILVYLKFGESLYSIPVSPNPTTTLNFFAEVGSVRVWYYSETNYDPGTSFQARYVIIPSNGRLAALSANPKTAIMEEFANAGVDISNYDEVAKYLEIK